MLSTSAYSMRSSYMEKNLRIFVMKVSAFGLPIIKAIGVSGDTPISEVSSYPVDAILLDAYAPVERGGTGKSFRWDVAREVKENHPDQFLILAGGLGPDNIAEAIQAAQPDAVDLASGVESKPGIKDLEKVQELLNRVRALSPE